jgi:DNA modification methylase
MILNANALHIPLASGTVQTCVTSPPYYGLRDYGTPGQLGLEQTPAEYVANMVAVFREVWRVLKDDGTCWLNLGDSYATSPAGNKSWSNGVGTNKHYEKESIHSKDKKGYGDCKPKDLLGIPWRVAFALQDDGWYLRSDIIWHKPNPMPESVTDRPTKSHEYIFLLTKSARYFYDNDAIKEKAETKPHSFGWKTTPHETGIRQINRSDVIAAPDGRRNRRSVWTVATQPYPGAHFATFPPKLIEPCILAGSRKGDIVLDPFSGSGTTGRVAAQYGREYVGLELNPEYIKLAPERMTVQVSLL